MSKTARLLETIAEEPGLTSAQLGERHGITASSVSALLNNPITTGRVIIEKVRGDSGQVIHAYHINPANTADDSPVRRIVPADQAPKVKLAAPASTFPTVNVSALLPEEHAAAHGAPQSTKQALGKDLQRYIKRASQAPSEKADTTRSGLQRVALFSDGTLALEFDKDPSFRLTPEDTSTLIRYLLTNFPDLKFLPKEVDA